MWSRVCRGFLGDSGNGGDAGEGVTVAFPPQGQGASAEQREQAAVWGVESKVGRLLPSLFPT